MITTTRQSDSYEETKVLGRYVRYEPIDATYRWCETAAFGKGKHRRILDVAVGICDESDLPGEVAAAARNACVIHPPYVEWPL